MNSITVRVELPNDEPPTEEIYIDDSPGALTAINEIMGDEYFILDYLKAFHLMTDENGNGEFMFEWEDPDKPGSKLTITHGQIREEY